MKRVALFLAALSLLVSLSCTSGVSLYFPEEGSFWLVQEVREIEAKDPLDVVNALLAGPQRAGLTTLIPQGVTVRSLEVHQGVCHIDFSAEFNNANYGSGPEAALLGMVVNTLTGLDGIEAVYITVEGEVPRCFAHIGSSGPFTWNESLVKKLRMR